jgi:hypothetical protein
MGGYLTGISPTLREIVTPTVDVFAAGVGFTAGSSTSVSLSADPGNENNIIVTMDGVVQHHDTYSVSGTTLTFDAAIPTGTAKIEARYAQEHPNYTVVADNAITNAKMNDDAIGVAELSASGTASSSTFLRGDNAWASAGSNVLEALHMVCDGSTTVVSSGSYTSTNVTAAQPTTTTYTDLSGSSISYTPPSGTKTVLYEFRYIFGYRDAQMESNHKLYLDGTEVANARFNKSNAGGSVGDECYFRWAFKIGDGAVAATGKVSSWSSAKIIKLQVRAAYTSYECKMHETHYWNGTTGSHLSKPTISVTSLS